MKNKRADVFNLYFILFVFVLCGIVIAAYVQNQNDADKAVLSSEPLLKIDDELRVLEYNEMLIAKNLISGGNFNINSFCTKMEDYSNFLRKDLVYKNNEIPIESWTPNSWSNFCTEIYEIETSSEGIILRRQTLRKEFEITITEEEKKDKKLNYPVSIIFEYEKEYKFDSTGNLIE